MSSMNASIASARSETSRYLISHVELHSDLFFQARAINVHVDSND